MADKNIAGARISRTPIYLTNGDGWPDDKAAEALCGPEAPHVVITSINRQQEDMAGLQMVRGLQRRRPMLRAIYLAALWPTRLHRCALGFHERFLPKPVSMAKFVRTVRELLPA